VADVDRWTDVQRPFTVRFLRKFLHTHIIKILHLTLNMFLHYLVKLLKIGIAADFNGILNVRPLNSFCEIMAWSHI